jgi:hypothetical protein
MHQVLFACLGASFGTFLVGCHTWVHAPGYEQRSAMTRTSLPIITGQWCNSWCDVKGPDGPLTLEDLETTGFGRRATTKFKMRYGSLSAECQGPVTNTGSPFACSISSTDNAVQAWLEVRPGCLSARLTRAPGASGGEALELRTDVLKIAGYATPAREISLLRGSEVLVTSDVPGGGVDVYTRPSMPLASTSILAIVAYHAFIHLEDKPQDCMN